MPSYNKQSQLRRTWLLRMATVVVVVLIGYCGWLLYTRDHTSGKIASPRPEVTASNTGTLAVTQLGIKIPLTSEISDAYYVVSTSSSDSKGQPDTIWLGVRSLDRVGSCSATSVNSGANPPIGGLLRALPNETDPVTGNAYSITNPVGSWVNGYYFGYIDFTNNEPCTTDPALHAKLLGVNAAFKSAVTHITAL